MNLTLHDILTHKKAISWLMLFAFLSMVLLPAHYHLHHDDEQVGADAAHHTEMFGTHHDTGFEGSAEHHDGATSKHVANIHYDMGIHDVAEHSSGHTIDSSGNIVLKLSKLQLPVLALLLVLLLLPVSNRKDRQLRAYSDQEQPHFNFLYRTPQLRAPPHS